MATTSSNTCSSLTQSPANVEDRDTQTPSGFVSFSPTTCLELLPQLTQKQIEFETNYFRSLLGSTFECKESTKKSPSALRNSLTKQLQYDTDRFIINCSEYDSVNDKFALLLNNAQELIDNIVTAATGAETHKTSVSQVMDTDDTPVSFLPCTVLSSVEECVKGIQFRKIGEREVEYFGKVAYPYGNTEHVPKVYPDTPIFKKISSAITQHDPNFSLDKYTCLVTRYQNGEAFIPAHSDDEHCIVPDSNIYTVSIGAQRTLVCHKTMGPLSEREYELTDGSVHVMSAASQLCWQHGIPPRKSCNDARVSFTFRLLDGNAKPPPKKHIPPIRENAPLDQPGRKKKVLFLSDSVNRGLNTHLFRGTGLVCIKRPNLFQLSQNKPPVFVENFR